VADEPLTAESIVCRITQLRGLGLHVRGGLDGISFAGTRGLALGILESHLGSQHEQFHRDICGSGRANRAD
jgi:hypothetical protein